MSILTLCISTPLCFQNKKWSSYHKPSLVYCFEFCTPKKPVAINFLVRQLQQEFQCLIPNKACSSLLQPTFTYFPKNFRSIDDHNHHSHPPWAHLWNSPSLLEYSSLESSNFSTLETSSYSPTVLVWSWFITYWHPHQNNNNKSSKPKYNYQSNKSSKQQICHQNNSDPFTND